MAQNTGIGWTDHTWNPWQGCRKVSAGCDNCYMFREKKRFGQDPATVIRSKSKTFNAPLKLKDPAKIFICSWSDFFIEDADEWRDEAWEIIRKTPHLTYQILTKRPENIRDRLPEDWGEGYKNVWLGVTAENQEIFNKRIPLIFEVPAIKHFVSIEPMLGEIHIGGWLSLLGNEGEPIIFNFLNWVIVGGETGPDARGMKLEWALNVKQACEFTKTPFFMKQMTNKEPIPDFLKGREFPNG